MTAGKYYNYVYTDQKLTQAFEYDAVISNENVTEKIFVCSISYFYNTDDRLTKTVTAFADGTKRELFYSDTENGTRLLKFKVRSDLPQVTLRSKTDSLGRHEFDSISLGTGYLNRNFFYHNGVYTAEHSSNEKILSQPTTNLVSRIDYTNAFAGGFSLLYEYDNEERITKVTEQNGETVNVTEYTYDALGQLLTEKVNGEVINTMTYDGYGNILTKNNIPYTYDSVWKDKVTAIGNNSVSYDNQGNPLNYLGHNLTWEKGRQLKSFDTNTYTYNANGIRTSKTINGITYKYILDGTKVLRQEWTEFEYGYPEDYAIEPIYDNEEIKGIIYSSTHRDAESYYFVKNLQGDVIAIADKGGSIVAKYSYDAWGKCTITEDFSGNNIASINPYRYRSYYYDAETGLYYVSSRYYDPEIGRFISADEPGIAFFVDSPNFNLYAYCENNVVNDCDYSGFASYRTRSKTLNKLIEALEKAIPNIYTEDFWCKEKRLLRVGTTNLSLAISCGVAAQTNKNALFGGLFKKGTLEVSAFFGVSNYVCFSFSAGITWSKAYIKVGLLLAMSRGPTGFYGGAYVELSVPTWLLAVATVAVGVASIYNPAVGAYIAKFIGSIRSSARVAAATLVPIFPYIVRAAT